MTVRSDQVLDEYGRAVPGATIYVYNQDGTSASIFSDAGLTIAIVQPVITDEFGVFTYYAADGEYREDIWFGGKLRYRQVIIVGSPASLKGDPGSPGEGFATRTAMAGRDAPSVLDDVYLTEAGREGKFVVDLASNWTAAITADTAQGLFVLSTADAMKVYRRVYDGAIQAKWFGVTADGTTDDSAALLAAIAALNALQTANLTTYGDGAPALQLPYAPNGINMGTTTLTISESMKIFGYGPPNHRGPGSALKWAANSNCVGIHLAVTDCELDGIAFIGGFVSGSSEGEFHAIKTEWSFTARDLLILNWHGDGIHIDSTGGNANCCFVENCTIDGNRNGIYIAGADANAGNFIGCNINFNRQWGIFDNSFLGNLHQGHQTANNGISGVGGSIPYTMVESGGHYYAVIAGQAAGASTNAPSGTTADNTWWYYTGFDGGATSTAPAWTSGISVRDGGPYFSGTSKFDFCYSEGGQPPTQIVTPGIVAFGSQQSGVKGNGLYIHLGGVGTAALEIGGGFRVTGSNPAFGSGPGLESYMFGAGPKTGAIDRTTLTFLPYTIEALSITFNPSGATSATIDSTGFNLASGKALSVNGTAIIDGGRNVTPATVASTGAVTSSGGGVGYATGAGGTVTQATSKSTGVTLNKLSGRVTMNAAALAAAAKVSFVVTNSQVAATDTVIVNVASGGTANAYRANVTAVAAGSFTVTVENITAGSLSEAPVLNFSILRAVAA